MEASSESKDSGCLVAVMDAATVATPISSDDHAEHRSDRFTKHIGVSAQADLSESTVMRHTDGVEGAAAVTQLNQTARIVLGMIAEGHTTGYAIKAEIERSTRLYWGASIGGIYPELRRLTDAGLISVRDDPRGESVRHCYETTEEGRAALRGWLTDPGAPAVELRDEALLQLRFAGVLAPSERLEVIGRKHALHKRRVAELQALLDAGQFDDPFHRLAIEFGLGWNRWACDWCEQTERGLAAADQSRPGTRLG